METKNVLLVLALAAVAYVFTFRYEAVECRVANCMFVIDRITGDVEFIRTDTRYKTKYYVQPANTVQD